jgi:hypothetical protein
MSKILEASCVGGVVTADGVPVPAADILSEGVGASEGVLMLEGEQAKYLPSSAGDIKTAIEKTVSAIQTVAQILTAIGASMTGPTTAPPPSLAADLGDLAATLTELTTLKETLK